MNSPISTYHYYLNPGVDLLRVKDKKDFIIHPPSISESYQNEPKVYHHPSNVSEVSENKFDTVKSTSSELIYQCVNCRGKDYKNNKETELTSINEEIKQEIIKKSKIGNLTQKFCTSNLTSLRNLVNKLAPNKISPSKAYK